jgi:hypothetical protein
MAGETWQASNPGPTSEFIPIARRIIHSAACPVACEGRMPTRLSTDELRALVMLGSDAAIESVESWREGDGRG